MKPNIQIENTAGLGFHVYIRSDQPLQLISGDAGMIPEMTGRWDQHWGVTSHAFFKASGGALITVHCFDDGGFSVIVT